MSRTTAETYASWFQCVADPTRLQVLHLLAGAARPLKVGEVAAALDLSQSTTSVHLQRLLADEFVTVRREGTASWYEVNADCLEQFPQAAAEVMAVVSGHRPTRRRAGPPWRGRASGSAAR